MKIKFWSKVIVHEIRGTNFLGHPVERHTETSQHRFSDVSLPYHFWSWQILLHTSDLHNMILPLNLSFGHLVNNGITYILRYIYSLKSYVVNLQCKWVLANQSSGRCFSHVKIKKTKTKAIKKRYVQSESRTIIFLHVREMMRLIRSPRDVWVSHQNSRLL